MEILTTKKASELYGQTPSFYRKLINSGKLEAWSTNPKYFLRSDLEKTLNKLKEPNKVGDIKW
jgi:hypothetical protein